MKQKRFKFIIYLIILVPSLIIFIELFLTLIFSLKKIKLPTNRFGAQKYDVINGWRNIDIKNQENRFKYLDKYGLVNTPFKSSKLKENNIKAIAITGNSVAMGAPILFSKFEDTFVNKLETNLREEDKRVDLINLSNSGYNSWQETVEVARYLNSFYLNDDLPKISYIASIGGIQDFWDFLDALNSKKFPMEEYYKANGLMSWDFQNGNYLEIISSAQNGNVISAFKILINSTLIKIRKHSNLFIALKSFKNNYLEKRFLINENQKYKVIKDKESYVTLEDILKNKLKISLNDYKIKRNNVLDSKIRNFEILTSMNFKESNIFIYLPSMININNNLNRKFTGIYKYKDLDLTWGELKVLEKDYRTELFKKLKQISNLEEFDLSNFGERNWFFDVSHFSLAGQEKISRLLLPIFKKIII